jgi:hypothetical protein
LDLPELHSLGKIMDVFALGPSRGGNTSAEIDECLIRNVDLEAPYCVAISASSKEIWHQTDGSRGCRGGRNVPPGW